jgi:hypothetical protein
MLYIASYKQRVMDFYCFLDEDDENPIETDENEPKKKIKTKDHKRDVIQTKKELIDANVKKKKNNNILGC